MRPTKRMSDLGFLAFSPSWFSCILWKAFCWKSFSGKAFLWKHILFKAVENDSYTQFFSGSELLIPQLPLWLVGRPWYVRILHFMWPEGFYSLGRSISLSIYQSQCTWLDTLPGTSRFCLCCIHLHWLYLVPCGLLHYIFSYQLFRWLLQILCSTYP